MIGSKLGCLVGGAVLAGNVLIAVASAPAAVAAVGDTWRGTVSVDESVTGAIATQPDTCAIKTGDESVTSSYNVNWHTSYSSTFSFTQIAQQGQEQSLYPTTSSSLSYSEDETQQDSSCIPNQETYSGSFTGSANAGGAHDAATVVVEQTGNTFYVYAATGLVTGTSHETAGTTDNNNSSAIWQAGTAQDIPVPIDGDTAAVTLSSNDNAMHDNGPAVNGFYGQSPWSLGMPASTLITVSLHRVVSTPTTPTTKITKGPAKTSSKSTATFHFTSSAADATFTCSVDGKKAKACTSSSTYRGLKPGKHTFSVDAFDPSDMLKDKTPATYHWKIKKKH